MNATIHLDLGALVRQLQTSTVAAVRVGERIVCRGYQRAPVK